MLKPTLFLLFGLLVAGTKAAADHYSVVGAQPLLADFVHEIAGDSIDVHSLVAADIDPHSYEPSPADLRRLVNADMVVLNGLGLEPWANRLVEHSGFRGVLVIASDGCPLRLPLSIGKIEAASAKSEYDPHAWHDPENVIHYVIVIRDALEKALPDKRTLFESRSNQYISKLRQLRDFAQRQLSAIPAPRRKLVTSHDSLQYLAKAFDLEIVSIAGPQPDQEPSARELAHLINFIREQHVPAVFFEPTSSPRLAQLVADEAEVKVVRELTTDGLGLPGTEAGTYVGMFRTNIETIVAALR